MPEISRMTSEEIHAGGCLCGAIRYVAEGSPVKVNVCYCTQCQRQSGSPLPAFATYTATQLGVQQGSPATYRSSENATREFCAQCGSTLFWREDGSAELDVFLGTFDDPGRLPAPSYAVWTAQRVPWLADFPGMRSHIGPRAS
jgi:hypothetical protein